MGDLVWKDQNLDRGSPESARPGALRGAPVVTLEASLQVGALLLRRVPGLGHTGFKHGCLAECMCRKLGH